MIELRFLEKQTGERVLQYCVHKTFKDGATQAIWSIEWKDENDKTLFAEWKDVPVVKEEEVGK